MIVNVSGSFPEHHDLVSSFCHFVAGELLGYKHLELEVDIEFEDDLFNESGILGDCISVFDDHFKDFTIRLDRHQDEDELLMTVAHEMVHVKQYATGELYQYSGLKGYRYKNDVYPHDYSYALRPWETEARIMEEVLVSKWLKELDYSCE